MPRGRWNRGADRGRSDRGHLDDHRRVRDPAHTRLGDRFTFATDGIVDAIARAKTVAATTDQDVVVMGGAGVIQSVLAAGLADQLWIHLAPVLFGAGTRLFDQLLVDVTELTPIDTISTPHATHLRYRFPR